MPSRIPHPPNDPRGEDDGRPEPNDLPIEPDEGPTPPIVLPDPGDKRVDPEV